MIAFQCLPEGIDRAAVKRYAGKNNSCKLAIDAPQLGHHAANPPKRCVGGTI
jgi:hypothetical protein